MNKRAGCEIDRTPLSNRTDTPCVLVVYCYAMPQKRQRWRSCNEAGTAL
jgi:hypothetical protein